jgi:putative membrane protein
MWVLWLILLVLVVIVLRAVAGDGSSTHQSTDQSPLEILKKCYARGEIDEEKFERRRRELEQ